MRKLVFLMSAIIIAFSSCQKNNTPAPAKVPSSDLRNLPSATTAVTPGTDVYVAGGYATPTSGVAAYWKNGTLVTLNDGFSLFDIAVSGNDVYVAGSSLGALQLDHAAYWKNGVIHYLNFGTSTTFLSTAYGVAINGSDVYVVGDYIDRSTPSNVSLAMLWKNGVPQVLSSGSARAIALIGNDVYITGYSLSGSNTTVATVWKNGVPTKLTGGQIVSSGNDIAVSGSDVYICGYTIANSSSASAAVYWKNGVLNPIRSNAHALAITINNNNVYIAGLVYYPDGTNQAVSWKNNAATATVYGPLNTLEAQGIAVSGSDTYVLAQQSGSVGESTQSNIYYYKNGTAYLVSYNAVGNKIRVVQN